MARSVTAAALRLATAVSVISRPSPTLTGMISTASSTCRPTRTLFPPCSRICPSFSFNRGYAQRRSQNSDKDLDDDSEYESRSDFEPSDVYSDFDTYKPDTMPFDDDDDGDCDDFSDGADDDEER